MYLRNLLRIRRRGSRRPESSRGGNGPDIVGLAEQILAQGAGFRIRVTGGSMAPLINPGDVVTIQAAAWTDLQRGDLVFYRSDDGPVVHRFIRVLRVPEGPSLHVKGDALLGYDPPFSPERLLGKVVRIEKHRLGPQPRTVDLEAPRRRCLHRIVAILYQVKLACIHRVFRTPGRRTE